ncbi:hypothetical protein ACIREM_27765 [Streptomyces shenzhenensis]|uniref:hypothetical protein n=1 Tax=Streptomyces shenzhenensis TaxID=943815 RepID=UPI0037F7EA59
MTAGYGPLSPGRLLGGLAVLAVTGAAALTGGGGGHGSHAHATDASAAVGVLGAVVACTLAFAWPSLRVALAPEVRRLTGRSVLAAGAAACALGAPLALTRAPAGLDAHVWAMVRFELLAVLGPVLLAYAVRAAHTPERGEGRGARLGAVVWAVSAYAWHLPPLHTLDGAGAEAARSFTWVTAGILMCLPMAACGGPFLAAHLAVLPLAALMATTGRGTAGLLMAATDATMALYLHNRLRTKDRHLRTNTGSTPAPAPRQAR